LGGSRVGRRRGRLALAARRRGVGGSPTTRAVRPGTDADVRRCALPVLVSVCGRRPCDGLSGALAADARTPAAPCGPTSGPVRRAALCSGALSPSPSARGTRRATAATRRSSCDRATTRLGLRALLGTLCREGGRGGRYVSRRGGCFFVLWRTAAAAPAMGAGGTGPFLDSVAPHSCCHDGWFSENSHPCFYIARGASTSD